jgi:apolipoprotein B
MFESLHLIKLTDTMLILSSPLLDLQIGEAIREGSKNDLFLHYIFMDNAFELPTGVGLQLHVSSSGIITPGTKAGVKLELANVRFCIESKQINDCCSFPPHF